MFRRRTAGSFATALLTLAAMAGHAGPLPDPTRPDYLNHAARAAAVAPGWQVTSIIISPSRRLANINGRMVKPGDRVDGATVLQIMPYAVKLENKHGIFTAYLLAGNIKRPLTGPHGT
ncbi:MAG: hypothetical protein ACYDB9_07495 [Gammaproteobacteria bacterium]